MTRPRLLIVSNGHGEDVVGTLLARRLLEKHRSLSLFAYPIVGKGDAYRREGISVVGVQQKMPTGGLTMKGRPADAWRDVRAGIVGLTLRQISDLKRRRHDVVGVIAVGDVVTLWMAGRYVRRPLMFVPTAKSEYIRGHTALEYALMRRYATGIFPRDEKTHRAMKDRGLPSDYVGNLMLDALTVTGNNLGLNRDDPVVALLPGSRHDAPANADDLMRVGERALGERENLQFILSVADGLDRREFEAIASRYDVPVTIVQGRFGDVLHRADVVVGLAGTANEQAVGMGKPLVTFVGRATLCTRRFFIDQQRLLGRCAVFVDEDHQPTGRRFRRRRRVPYARVAREVAAILANPHRYEDMSTAGKRRMGKPGAACRMSRKIVDMLQQRGVL